LALRSTLYGILWARGVNCPFSPRTLQSPPQIPSCPLSRCRRHLVSPPRWRVDLLHRICVHVQTSFLAQALPKSLDEDSLDQRSQATMNDGSYHKWWGGLKWNTTYGWEGLKWGTTRGWWERDRLSRLRVKSIRLRPVQSNFLDIERAIRWRLLLSGMNVISSNEEHFAGLWMERSSHAQSHIP